MSQLEKGKFYASLKIIGRVAEVLDIEPAELLKRPPKRGSASGKGTRPTGTVTAWPRWLPQKGARSLQAGRKLFQLGIWRGP